MVRQPGHLASLSTVAVDVFAAADLEYADLLGTVVDDVEYAAVTDGEAPGVLIALQLATLVWRPRLSCEA